MNWYTRLVFRLATVPYLIATLIEDERAGWRAWNRRR